jgi:hypothetical protein
MSIFFFASLAVRCELCDTAVLLELKQYRKGRNEPQRTQGRAQIIQYTILLFNLVDLKENQSVWPLLFYDDCICFFLPWSFQRNLRLHLLV